LYSKKPVLFLKNNALCSLNLDTIGALRTGNDGLRQEKVPPLKKGECTAKRLLRYKLRFADTEKKFSTYFWYKNPEDPLFPTIGAICGMGFWVRPAMLI